MSFRRLFISSSATFLNAISSAFLSSGLSVRKMIVSFPLLILTALVKSGKCELDSTLRGGRTPSVLEVNNDNLAEVEAPLGDEPHLAAVPQQRPPSLFDADEHRVVEEK